MKTSTLLLASLLFHSLAVADDALRDVQAELKKEGFYYGEVSGKDGTETGAAIRRYQIRFGLEVTGKLNEETLGALGMKGEQPKDAPPKTVPSKAPDRNAPPKPAPVAKQVNPPRINEPVPDPTEPSIPPKRRADLVRDPEDRPPAPRLVDPRDADDRSPGGLRRARPNDPAVVDPPSAIPSPTYDDYTTFYHGTPYASAPREVQLDVLRKAQTNLGRKGLYRAVADGLPGPATSEALFLYQDQRRLTRTGRLDMATLADLNLLPGRGPDAPPVKPFYDPNRRRDRSVDLPGTIR
jgi:peptidoglycan hydrolase-like protein with peptidoglycan-binding domain